MIWQDYAISAIQIAFILALVPAIRGQDKPARSSCLMTAVLLYSLGVIFSTLGLWFAVATSVGSGIAWTILLIQKRPPKIDAVDLMFSAGNIADGDVRIYGVAREPDTERS